MKVHSFLVKMNSKIKFFLCTLLLFKAIVSIHAEEHSYEYDVTKQLDNWIFRMFKINSDTFKKLFSRITAKQVDSFNLPMKRDIHDIGSTFRCKNVYMNITEFKSPKLNWKFTSNKMTVFLKEFTVRMMGKMLDNIESEKAGFDTCVDLENVTFTLSNDPEKFLEEFTYDNNYLWFNEGNKIYWSNVKNEMDDSDNSNDLSHSVKQALEEELTPILPKLLMHNLKHNEHFFKDLKTIFHVYFDTKTKLTETYKDFFINDQKYYYLIPKIPFFSFNMKNVFLRGLYNMEWLKINTGTSIFTHTLMIRNVQGNFLLDFGIPSEKPVNLQFKIDYLSLSIDKKMVNVEARCFSVNKTNTQLPYRQSALIMQRIETAIANSIFPTLDVCRTYEIDTPLEQIKITENTDWNTIKKSFNEWIPFNEDAKPPAAGAPQIKT